MLQVSKKTKEAPHAGLEPAAFRFTQKSWYTFNRSLTRYFVVVSK